MVYRIDVEQDPKKPYFLYGEGLDGVFVVRWPEIRCREEGAFSGYHVIRAGQDIRETRHAVREGYYNFDTQLSVGRDNYDLVQITAYRHAFSTHAFPLRNQFFVEMEQKYVPGKTLETHYWLPNALEQNKYTVDGKEVTTEGIACHILSRIGLDRIWVATERGYSICKREYKYGVGRPLRERVESGRLSEIAPGVWFPMRQTREEFDEDGKQRFRQTLQIVSVRVGNIIDSELKVDLDKAPLIEDQVSGSLVERLDSGAARFDRAIEQARNQSLKYDRSGNGRTVLLSSGVFFLFICIVVYLRRM
jgi:hypothetical protein